MKKAVLCFTLSIHELFRSYARFGNSAPCPVISIYVLFSAYQFDDCTSHSILLYLPKNL